ncbi:MAG TPA: IS66 family insertion sequence element accessory protein TnpB [Bacteroidales bacterium]
MFSLTSSHQYFLYAIPTDMRGSFNSLCGIVQSKLGRSPTSGEVYVFLNRRRTHVKLLHWENGGFVMYYKRLESGNFEVPSLNNGALTWSQLVMMIEGVSLKDIKMRKRFYLRKSA